MCAGLGVGYLALNPPDAPLADPAATSADRSAAATDPAVDPAAATVSTPGGGERPLDPTGAGTPPAATPARAALPADPAATAALLADAKRTADAGAPLAARSRLNAALLAAALAPPDADAVRAALADLNRTILFGPRPFAADPYQSLVTVEPGDLMQRIAARHDVTWELLSRVNDDLDPRRLRAGAKLKVIRGPFHAVVSKSRYAIDLYLGALPAAADPSAPGTPAPAAPLFVATFPVGLGTENGTPEGLWRVDAPRKLKNPTYHSPRGEGIVPGDDPSNPLGERWIPLEGIGGDAVGRRSYGIHGTIEPQTIGTQSSLGCVRLLNADVEFVYDLLTADSTVRIEP